ncbi:LLM class F420-dependent oxidoreductase [Tomitella gaofuii]|uniref:LLM class F420-dependent oxidoreductase n=1 Tax=Tomitella gaofuii TaxID=2760083 RepID=UPI0015FB9C80|nr:LLM class F420-dependent oxidoreductase [Tomitella gaofuii]
MRFGVTLFTSDRGITPAAAARAAEDAGFDAFYVPEHTHIPARREAAHPATGDASLPDDRYMRTLDPWVALGTAIPVTSTIRLGTCVALPVEHDPLTLAKTIATVDHLAGGRVTLGVGFGWNLDELRDHGVPIGRRRTMLREYLEAMQALWDDEEAEYHGEFVDFDAAWAWPKPVQPRVPVIVGCAGNEKNFRWIARNADGWMTTPREDGVDAGIAGLRRAWAEAGRDGAPLIHALVPGRPDPDELARWRDLGVTEAICGMPDADEPTVAAYLQHLAGRVAHLREPASGDGPPAVPVHR